LDFAFETSDGINTSDIIFQKTSGGNGWAIRWSSPSWPNDDGPRLYTYSDSGNETFWFHKNMSKDTKYWLRLVREGNTVTGYYSTNGQNYTQAFQTSSSNVLEAFDDSADGEYLRMETDYGTKTIYNLKIVKGITTYEYLFNNNFGVDKEIIANQGGEDGQCYNGAEQASDGTDIYLYTALTQRAFNFTDGEVLRIIPSATQTAGLTAYVRVNSWGTYYPVSNIELTADEYYELIWDNANEEWNAFRNLEASDFTDLTDSGDSTLHYHASDRARSNHTGTQAASTISDFDTEVSNNTDVAANTTARHSRKHDINGTDDHNGVGGATEDNFVSFDANGLPKDSGHNDTDYEDAGAVATHATLTETHGATGAIMGTTNTQEVSNKTLTPKATVKGNAASDAATLGSELVTNGTFDSDLSGWTISDTGTKWTWDATGAAIHNGDGNTETISQNVNVTLDEYYVLAFTISGRTAGTLTPSLNGVNGYAQSTDNTYYFSWKATATAAHSLMFTPSGTFNGKLDDISFKQVTADLAALIELKDSGGAVSAEMRSGTNTLYNFFIGYNSGKNNYNGHYNAAIGYATMQNNTIGHYNAAIGYAAMQNNITGYANAAIGYAAMRSNITGSANVAIGYTTMHYNTTGSTNAAIGYAAMYHNTTGSTNAAIGFTAMRSNTTGSANAAIGSYAMRHSQTGNNNISIGGYSCGYGTGAVFTAASNHVVIGHQAGYNIGTSDSANVMIGYQAGYNETGSNKLYISNTNTATPLIYGEFDNGILGFTAQVGIGTKTPNANAALDIASTTKAFMPPRMTTVQKNAIGTPAAGMVVYDTDLSKLCVYTNAWETITSS